MPSWEVINSCNRECEGHLPETIASGVAEVSQVYKSQSASIPATKWRLAEGTNQWKPQMELQGVAGTVATGLLALLKYGRLALKPMGL